MRLQLPRPCDREDQNSKSRNDVEKSILPSPPMSHSEKNIITWDGPDDPENPFNWPSSKKWRVTVLACSITFLSGISGTALAPTAPLLTSTFHLAPDATRTIPPTYYPIFAWTLSAGVIPLLLLPLMETYYGVRTPYLLCVLTLALSTIPQALAPGGADGGAYPLLIAIRILTGGAAGVLQNVTGGIVGDVWAGPRARSKPVALYIWALVGGLMAGPVVGGGTLAIYAALVPLAYLLLPETRGAIILVRRAAAVRKATGDPNVRAEGEEEAGGGGMSLAELLKDAVGRPLRMLTTEPLVACSTLWSAFCFGNALLFTQSIPRVYGELYGWESWRAGVVQAGLLVGVTLGLVVGAPVQDALLRIEGWETKCDFCPHCAGWNLSNAEFRLVSNDRSSSAGGLSRSPSSNYGGSARRATHSLSRTPSLAYSSVSTVSDSSISSLEGPQGKNRAIIPALGLSVVEESEKERPNSATRLDAYIRKNNMLPKINCEAADGDTETPVEQQAEPSSETNHVAHDDAGCVREEAPVETDNPRSFERTTNTNEDLLDETELNSHTHVSTTILSSRVEDKGNEVEDEGKPQVDRGENKKEREDIDMGADREDRQMEVEQKEKDTENDIKDASDPFSLDARGSVGNV
ncbi:hypothetical protein BFW01_g9852 [Lasiodiplodia theobromae]|nr:hypothetical protein BFW01_g9852 [Lasiodiplodia theobromae]